MSLVVDTTGSPHVRNHRAAAGMPARQRMPRPRYTTYDFEAEDADDADDLDDALEDGPVGVGPLGLGGAEALDGDGVYEGALAEARRAAAVVAHLRAAVAGHGGWGRSMIKAVRRLRRAATAGSLLLVAAPLAVAGLPGLTGTAPTGNTGNAAAALLLPGLAVHLVWAARAGAGHLRGFVQRHRADLWQAGATALGLGLQAGLAVATAAAAAGDAATTGAFAGLAALAGLLGWQATTGAADRDAELEEGARLEQDLAIAEAHFRAAVSALRQAHAADLFELEAELG